MSRGVEAAIDHLIREVRFERFAGMWATPSIKRARDELIHAIAMEAAGADETAGLGPKGDSAGLNEASPTPTPDKDSTQ